MRRGPRALAAILVTVLAAPAAAHEAPPPGPASPLTARPSLSAIRAAPDLVLRDVGGRRVGLADLRGRIVLVSFVYTRCTAACPLLAARLARLQQRIASLPSPSRPALLSISVDPERDSAADLRRYAARFGADGSTWRFLRDDPARVRATLLAWDEGTRPAPGGELDHPARVYLVDRAGTIREIYALAFFDDRQAWLDIQALLREP